MVERHVSLIATLLTVGGVAANGILLAVVFGRMATGDLIVMLGLLEFIPVWAVLDCWARDADVFPPGTMLPNVRMVTFAVCTWLPPSTLLVWWLTSPTRGYQDYEVDRSREFGRASG